MCSHLSWRVVTPLSLQFSHCMKAKKKSLPRFSAELYSLKPVTLHVQTVCAPEIYITLQIKILTVSMSGIHGTSF